MLVPLKSGGFVGTEESELLAPVDDFPSSPSARVFNVGSVGVASVPPKSADLARTVKSLVLLLIVPSKSADFVGAEELLEEEDCFFPLIR